jgi:hypothetical protein
VFGSRARIVAAAVVVGATTVLPWFGESGPGARRASLNAWQANALFPALAMVLLALFVATALYALTRDIRWLGGSFAAALTTFVVFMTQCWLNHKPVVANASVSRRWGLFVALNAAFALGAVVRSVGDRAMAGWLGSNDMPIATGYELD